MVKSTREYAVYGNFMVLKKLYEKVNMELMYQVLRRNDMGCKLLNGIKGIYFNTLACVRVKGGENCLEVIVM